MERDAAHAAPLLDSRGRDLPPRDRDLLRALVKRTLRAAIRLDHVLTRHLDRPAEALEPAVRSALRLGAAQLLLFDRIPKHAAVGETVAAIKVVAPRAAGYVNAVLRNVASREERPGLVMLPVGADPLDRLALESSHPAWLVRRWVARFGEAKARAALEVDERDAPFDLLLDPRLGSTADQVAELEAAGFVTEPSPWAPLARTVLSGEASALDGIVSGRVAVVDAAAQGLVELLPPAPIVVDLAAAPGGKTRTLLARGIARRVVALELQPSRARRMALALSAAGLGADVLVVRADASRPPLAVGRFRSVLLDAPCSGTGTLRKNPEIGLRLKEADLPEFARRQRVLLRAALALLAPGGTLAYVTCSLEPEENEGAVRAALAERRDVSIAPLPASLLEPLRACGDADGFLRIAPGRTNDGFTACALVREG